jgi:hypothetical protein
MARSGQQAAKMGKVHPYSPFPICIPIHAFLVDDKRSPRLVQAKEFQGEAQQ